MNGGLVVWPGVPGLAALAGDTRGSQQLTILESLSQF